MKRIFDIFVSALGIVLCTPIWLIIPIAIKLDSKGPIFYTQKRVGKGGNLFIIYKFRTMSVGTDQSSISVAGQSRITLLGAKLRHYKLDELPELWNVLIGEMSLVGPRPDVPGYADQLKGEDRIILALKPGITGPASLKYRNEEELLSLVPNPEQYNNEVIFPDKVRINKYYAEHYSFIKDIQMIFCTIFGQHMVYNGEII